jgi:undecaprenyl-diphosphatase
MTPVMQELVLGVIQGLGEFLPISSSAHLVLIPRYFHWTDPGLAFDVALHLGTLAGAVFFFRKELLRLALAVLRPGDAALSPDRRMTVLIILATIPAAVAGLLLEHKAETVFRSSVLIAWALIALGVALGGADILGKGTKSLNEMALATAFWIGAAQALALIPGISRSGITITTALFLGYRRDDAARFSFLLSIPIIAGAGLLKCHEIFRSTDKAGLALGFFSAAVAGFAAIHFLLRYVRTRRYTPFVVYRMLLGAFVLAFAGRFL